MTRLACMSLWCQKGQLTKWGSNFVLQCVETNPRSLRCLCLVWSCNKIWGPGSRCHSSTGSPGKSSHPAPLSILWGTLRNPVCACVCVCLSVRVCVCVLWVLHWVVGSLQRCTPHYPFRPHPDSQPLRSHSSQSEGQRAEEDSWQPDQSPAVQIRSGNLKPSSSAPHLLLFCIIHTDGNWGEMYSFESSNTQFRAKIWPMPHHIPINMLKYNWSTCCYFYNCRNHSMYLVISASVALPKI